MRPRGCDIESLDLRTLVGWPYQIARWIGRTDIQVVKGVRALKPGAGEPQVQLSGVRVRELEIQPIKDVLLVALGVHNGELRWIEEPTTVQSVQRDVVTNLIAAICEVESRGCGAERPV